MEDPQLGVDAMAGPDAVEPYQGPGGGAPSAIVEALQHYADDDEATTITEDVDEVGAAADVSALTIDADVAQAAGDGVLDGGESGGLDTDLGELGDVVRANAGPAMRAFRCRPRPHRSTQHPRPMLHRRPPMRARRLR